MFYNPDLKFSTSSFSSVSSNFSYDQLLFYQPSNWSSSSAVTTCSCYPLPISPASAPILCMAACVNTPKAGIKWCHIWLLQNLQGLPFTLRKKCTLFTVSQKALYDLAPGPLTDLISTFSFIHSTPGILDFFLSFHLNTPFDLLFLLSGRLFP